MLGVRLDVSGTAASARVRTKRAAFDAHLDGCTDCQPSLCWSAESLWHEVCIVALRAQTGSVTEASTSGKDGA